jgi:hypothetical protein
MRKSIVYLLLFVPVLLFGAAAQEENSVSLPEDQTVYIINDVDIQVEGQTKPFAIEYAADIQSGTLILGKKNLEAYIAEKNQILASLRTFDELIMTYDVNEANEYHQIPVTIFISVKDTSNFILYPSPKYDSNKGLTLELSAHHFNFLGTLNRLNLSAGYARDTKGNNGALLESDLLLPFLLGRHVWTLDFANSLQYMQNSPVFYQNDIGLLTDIPYKKTTLSFGLYESLYVNEKNDERDKAAEGDFFRDVWYLNTTALARWNIPTGIDVFGLGELEYTPELNFGINYRPGGDIGNSRRGFEITMRQTLGFGQLNWDGNFRTGTIASIENNNTYNFYSGNWDNQFLATGIYHKKFTDYTGISLKVRWAQWFQRYYNNAGDVIRGVPDENLAADFMLSVNLQESFRMFNFMPSIWFNNPSLRIMNFEAQIAPFIDLALVQDPLHLRSFNIDEMIVTAGFELTAYPFYFQSSFFRLSLGVDVRKMVKTGLNVLSDGNYRELYIGVGHYF